MQKKIGLFAVIFFSFVFALSSFSAMMADAFAFRASMQERYWAAGRSIEFLSQWQEVERQTKTALSLSPHHTDYLLLLGRLGSWYMFTAEEGQDITPVVEQSYKAFTEALAQRPYWSMGWSEYALLKGQLGDVDQDFEFAVYAAITTGPFEAKTLLNIFKATFGEWQNLNTDLKSTVKEVFAVAIELPYHTYVDLPREAMALAKVFELTEELCENPEMGVDAIKACDKALKKI